MAGVEPGLYAKTITSDVRVRSKPGLGEDSEKLEPLLEMGARFLVVDGPVEASGYDWFLIRPRSYDDSGHVFPTGWIAAGKDGKPWIKPIAFDCPAKPTSLDGLKDLASDYWLSCFAGVDITFTARLEQTGYQCSSPEGIEPAWFDRCPWEFAHSLVAPKSFSRFIGQAWVPDVDMSIAASPAASPELWPTVKVTGQFDHPAAKTCRRSTDTANDYQPAFTILYCRNTFVVTSMREIDQ